MIKNKATFRKRKSKLGDFILDLTKYITTAVLFTAVFKGAKDWELIFFLPVVAIIILGITIGIWLQEADTTDNKKKK